VKKRKTALKAMKKSQLRTEVRKLRKLAKDVPFLRSVREGQASMIEKLHRESRALHNEIAGIRSRASACRRYFDDAVVKEGISLTGFSLAVPEYVAYGPAGEYPARNGVHPFKRWNIETPEDRADRLAQEHDVSPFGIIETRFSRVL
jgi:hypothetical protein